MRYGVVTEKRGQHWVRDFERMVDEQWFTTRKMAERVSRRMNAKEGTAPPQPTAQAH